MCINVKNGRMTIISRLCFSFSTTSGIWVPPRWLKGRSQDLYHHIGLPSKLHHSQLNRLESYLSANKGLEQTQVSLVGMKSARSWMLVASIYGLMDFS